MEKAAKANDRIIAKLKKDHAKIIEKLKKDHAQALEEAVEANRESLLKHDHVSWQLAKQKSPLGMINAKFKKHRQQQEQTIQRLKTANKKNTELSPARRVNKVRAHRKLERNEKSVGAIKLALSERQKETEALAKEKDAIEQDMTNLRLEVIGLEGEVQILRRVTQFDDLFAKTRESPKGG